MKKLILLLFVLVLFSFDSKNLIKRSISKVHIEHIFEAPNMSIRAITTNNSNDLFVSGNNSSVGFSDYSCWVDAVNMSLISYDSLVKSQLEFRAISQTKEYLFFLSIGSPSFLYKIKKKELYNFHEIVLPKLVYKENHPKVFYDAMDFWNDQEGIAIGDPTDDCMSIIITRDGGETWVKLSCEELPKAKDGEAAFAASDTNIAIVGNQTWVATGGKASRILYSPDKGKTWEVFDTPIIQGKETTGMYSIDFYDELHGFAIGGDYTKPDENAANKIRTSDGGKTWELIAQSQTPGYRSCVQYIPNSKGKELVAIGFKGIDYSNDAGSTWKHFSDEGFYTIRFLNDSVAYAAGKGRISKLTFRE